jgi:hypothetical protein
MLQHNIDQSVQAQAQNLNSEHNLLRANLQQFGNLKEATMMTKLQLSDALGAQIGQAAAKAKSQGAQSAAQLAKSDLAAKYLPIAQHLNMYHALNTLSGNSSVSPDAKLKAVDSLMVTNPEMYKEYKDRSLQGIGITAQPVDASKRNEIESQQKFENAAADLAKYMKQHSGVLETLKRGVTPGQLSPEQAVAMQKAMVVQSLFREGTLGTVYKKGEQPLLDQAVSGNPISMLNYFTEPAKVQELRNSNLRSLSQTLDNLGGDASVYAQHLKRQVVQPTAPSVAEGSLGMHNGRPTVFRGGKWIYQGSR